MDERMRRQLEASVLAGMSVATATEMRWSEDDCSMWVANILRPVLGYDPAEDFRGKYADQSSAHDRLGKLGLGYAIRRVASKHGWKRILPCWALSGDVGAMMVGRYPVTLICRDRGWFVGRNENGVTMVTDKAVRLAWSVLS